MLNVKKVIQGMIWTHIYAGYFDIKSSEVNCPNVTSKSAIKKCILMFSFSNTITNQYEKFELLRFQFCLRVDPILC